MIKHFVCISCTDIYSSVSKFFNHKTSSVLHSFYWIFFTNSAYFKALSFLKVFAENTDTVLLT